MSPAEIARGLGAMEREWILGWQGPPGAAFNVTATGLRRKGLLVGPLNWNLSPLGLAVRAALQETDREA